MTRFAAVAMAMIVLLAAAMGLAHHRRAPILWGRVVVIFAGVYAAGCWASWWPESAGIPILNWIIGEFGGRP